MYDDDDDDDDDDERLPTLIGSFAGRERLATTPRDGHVVTQGWGDVEVGQSTITPVESGDASVDAATIPLGSGLGRTITVDLERDQ